MMTIDGAALQEITVRHSGARAERVNPESICRRRRGSVNAISLKGINVMGGHSDRGSGFRVRVYNAPRNDVGEAILIHPATPTLDPRPAFSNK